MFTFEDKIRFYERAFGPVNIRKGHEKDISVKCPQCNPTNASKKKLVIRVADDLTHCWVCGFSSKTLLPLLVKYSTRELVSEYKSRFLKYKPSEEDLKEEEEIICLPNDFRLLSLLMDSSDPDIKRCISYLKSRGLTDKEIWRFKIGYSEDSMYKGRVIVPSFDSDGKLNFTVARKISDQQYGVKYINSRAKKTEIIFNELTIDWNKELTIVEGPFDLFKVNENATCLLGSELNENSKLFNKILENQTKILLCLDNDMRLKSLGIAKKLQEYNIEVNIVDMSKHTDPGDLKIDEFEKVKQNTISYTWENYLLEKLSKIGQSGSILR